MDPNPPTAGDLAYDQAQEVARRMELRQQLDARRDDVLENIALGLSMLLDRLPGSEPEQAARVLVRSVAALRASRGTETPTHKQRY